MKRLHVSTALALTALSLSGCGAAKHVNRPEDPAPRPTLSSVVEAARVKHGLPAIAAASFSLDSIEVAVRGIRRLGTPGSATTSDLFHVGSLAKAMTATTVARLVEQGTLSWTLTLAEAFPEQAGTMNAAYREVTLAELLQNRSGLPGVNEYEEFLALPEFHGDLAAQRRAFANWLLSQPPAVPRGEYLYSTGAFSLAAVVAERAAGRSWESLLRGDVLDPLGTRMFVGWPLEAGPDQPCGHMMVGPALQPVDPSAGHIPAVLAPGGDVSMTVADYATFAQLHLRALCGRPELLRPESWRRLHAPVGDYAMGWSVLEVGGNTVLTHTGSPETFFAFVVLYRDQKHGFVVITNATSPSVDAAIGDILVGMAPTISAAESGLALSAARAGKAGAR